MNRPSPRPRSAGAPRAGVVRVLRVTMMMVAAALGAATLFPAPTIAAVGPVAQAFSPPAGAVDISPLLPIWVKFKTPIDVATLTADTFYLTPLGSLTKVPATLTYVAINRAILTPTTPLTNGVTYQATVTVGIKDALGNPLQFPWTWTFTVVPAGPPDTFVDVLPGAPYYTAIQGLYEAGIVSGDNGPLGPEFRPNNPVWRQQFAKMICGVFDLTVTEGMTSPFTDLDANNPTSLYPNEYVAAAYANGITTGTTATTFGPFLDISRAQVITMVVRALQNLAPGTLEPAAPGFVPTWDPTFSPIHGPNALLAEANGLLDGLGVDVEHPAGDLAALDPWGVMPRGEVAQLLWNALQKVTP
jgi:Bacterial Ig-like domain/S-layer homology domain